jgi:hypothetical protein
MANQQQAQGDARPRRDDAVETRSSTEHSGEGSRSALAQMKQRERSRAELADRVSREGPSQG